MKSSWSWLGCLLLQACAGGPQYEPEVFAPDSLDPLELPATAEAIAVLTLEDRRPDFERRSAPLVQAFSSDSGSPPSYYWFFDGEDEVLAPDRRGLDYPRITGDGAFLWYPFPRGGPGGPQARAPAEGLADYLAFSLEKRRIAERVIRVSSLEEARAAGASYVLGGALHSFAGLFVEDHSPYIPRPDDVREFRLYTRFDLELVLTPVSSEEPLWGARYSDPPDVEDDPHVFDELGAYRGVNFLRIPRLDQEDQPLWAYRDLLGHLERRLHAATGEALAEMESALRQTGRID